MTAPPSSRPISLALQGGSTHGAFTWGVLDRFLVEVEAGTLRIEAISGASAGAMNAVVAAVGLMEGGPTTARQRLEAFWQDLSQRGTIAGNALFGYGEPGPSGWNIDWSPGAILLEAAGLVISPYTNIFYQDSLEPLLKDAFPGDTLDRLNRAAGPKLILSAVDVATNARKLFRQPHISLDAIRASACLPTEFKTVSIGGTPYWDGGYIGNPPLAPLIRYAEDIVVVTVNPFRRTGMPPHDARGILDRMNQITFNASVVLEMNAIEAVNSLLTELEGQGVQYAGKYKRVHLHRVHDDAFMATLGRVSKESTSWNFLRLMHKKGFEAAANFLRKHEDELGRHSTAAVKQTLTGPLLKGADPAAPAPGAAG